MVIWSCSGFLLQNSSSADLSTHQHPPEEPLDNKEENLPPLDHLRTLQEPSQKPLETREEGKRAPPLLYVNHHSDIHKGFQAGISSSLPETETSNYVDLNDELLNEETDAAGIGDGVLQGILPRSFWHALHTQVRVATVNKLLLSSNKHKFSDF